jgi:hypothetical protein
MRIVITEQEKKDILSSYVLIENVKQAKKYVELGLLSKDVLEKLISFDPSKTNKYVGWMSKIWMSEHPDLDQLRNTIEEYDVFLNKGKVKTKDINQFKTFKDLYSEVDGLNQSGEGVSNKDLELDYDTVVNNKDLLIMSPHTHEASRKLGLSHFSFRDCGNGEKDSAWCTTFKSPNHFNDYYYKHNVTFYYIKVKSEQMIQKLKKSFPDRWKELIVVALAVLNNGQIDAYDGLDKQINNKDIKIFLSIIKLNGNTLVSKRSAEERSKNLKIVGQKKIQQYIKDGSQGTLNLSDYKKILLPKNLKVGGDLVLKNLTSIPEGFNPTVRGYLDLSSLTLIPQGFNPTVGMDLFLSSLTSIPQGFNPTVGGRLVLSSLTSIPQGFNPTVGGSLYLYNLISIPEGFNPTVGGSLYLYNLTSIPEGFNPTVGGNLDLYNLTSIPEGFNPTVGGNLDLSSLTSIDKETLKRQLPNVKGDIVLKN